MIIVSLGRIVVSLSCVRTWDWGLPYWVKSGVRSIEESDQKDVDADRGHMPWTACARCQLEIQHRGSMSVGNLKNLRRVNHNYCGILYYIIIIVILANTEKTQ
jgi:hypothetical protein